MAITLLLTVDLGRFRGNLEDYVSEATGRQFAIGGDFDVSVGASVDLLAEHVRLANADWGVAANILEADRVVISVDTWSLLSGPIEVLNLEVVGLDIHVEKDQGSERSSWSFGAVPVADDADEKPDFSFELPIWLHQARLAGISVTYGQGWLDSPRNITVDNATLAEDESDLLRLELSGALGEDPLQAGGLVGPLSALIDGKQPRFELEVDVGRFTMSTIGTFRDLFGLEGPDFNAAMQGPLAENVLGRFGLPPIARGPVDIAANLSESPDGVDLRVEGSFGDLTTDVAGRAQSLRELSNLEMSADIRGPDLQAVGALFGAGFLPSAEFSVVGDLNIAGDILELGSIELSAGEASITMDGRLAPEDIEPGARLEISATGPEIRAFLPPALAERIPPGAFDIQATVAGGLQQPQFRVARASLGDHEASADGVLPLTANLAGLDVAVTAGGPDFDVIAGPWVDRDLVDENYSLKTRILNDGEGFEIRDLTFGFDSGSIRLDGTTGILPGLAGMDLSVQIRGEDLQGLLEPWLDLAVPAVPFELEGEVRESRGALVLTDFAYRVDDAAGTLDGTTGTLPSFDGLRLTSSLTGPDARRFADLMTELEDVDFLTDADFEISNELSKTVDGWIFDPLQVRIGESRFEMSGRLGNLSDLAGIDIDFATSGPDLRRFLPDRGIEVPIPFAATGGLRTSGTEIAFEEIDIRAARTTAWLDGTLPASAELTDAEFDLRIAGPDLARIGRVFGFEELPPDEYRVEGSLQRSGNSYSIENLAAVVGENDLSGSLGVEIGDKLRLTGEIESTYLNLSGLREQREDAATSGPDEITPDRLIPDTPLPLQLLDMADIDITLRLKELVTDLFDVGTVEMNLVIDGDKLHADTTRVNLSNGGTLTALLDVIRTSDEQADVRLSVVAEQFRLRPPIDDAGNPINRPPQDLDLQISASGSAVRDLAASANGSIDLRIGAGDIDNEFNGYLMRDLVSQVFAAINPLAKDSELTRLNCGFVNVDIVDGLAKGRAVGFQTKQLAMASVGTLNLATEELDLSFRVKQREGVGISLASVINPYVKLGGSLASPAITIDKKRGIFSGTVAVLTGGLSILAQGVWDRYLSQDDYCQAVIDALESGEIPVWTGETDNP